MSKHKRTSHIARYVRAVQGEGLIKAAQRVSLGLVTGGMVAMALVLGAQAAPASTHGSSHHAVADQTCRPWMYHCPATVSNRPWMY
jgi:hypothetical protein